ncbi:MAG TPA: urease accessory UreF family protein [Candidatus Limnocylindria bacterium]|nr:urease accessory UreF family protein [Candidatus Limnocylindria bacterium]
MALPPDHISRTAVGAGEAQRPPEPAREWLVWQLADSAFPTGGFAHSAGLEAAWQHGELRSARAVESFIEASLLQAGYSALPMVFCAWEEPERWRELDALCEAFTANHVANRASRLQGRALLASARRIFRDLLVPDIEAVPAGHLAPIFGRVFAALGVGRDETGRLFLFQQLRSLVAAAVRLGVVGPLEGQSIQSRLAVPAERLYQRCRTLGLDDIAQTAPLQDLWQGTQDRLYSRLFQS